MLKKLQKVTVITSSISTSYNTLKINGLGPKLYYAANGHYNGHQDLPVTYGSVLQWPLEKVFPAQMFMY